MINKDIMRNCGAMEQDQGMDSITKSKERTPRESMDKKQFPIMPYPHGKGLINLTAQCNTPSHPLRASGLGITGQ